MTEPDDTELSEFLADPLSVLFDLNDELLEGIDRIRYALGFTFWAGGLISVGSMVYAVWLLLVDQPNDAPWYAILLALLAWVSAYACYSAHSQRAFLEDYKILGFGVQRANEWKPNPKIPEGPDAMSRLISHLKETDGRIGYIIDRDPAKLEHDASIKGKSKKTHRFDLFMAADKPFGLLTDPVPEGMILLVRKVERATADDVTALKVAAEDVLRRLYPSDQAARVVLLQTGGGEFSESAAEFVNKNWMRYDRSIDDGTRAWSSPVELVAERHDGTYNLENMYFG